MGLVVELPPGLETALSAEAARSQIPLPGYVVRLLATGRLPVPKLATGADLVACWREAGLIGSRPEDTGDGRVGAAA